jgi:glucose-1-phosphate thymidylyltransferase
LRTTQIVGIIPAAGQATRLGHLPLSKEVYPIGFEKVSGLDVPKVISSYLLENMAKAGITEFHFVLRHGKWDIPAYYKGGGRYDYNICYHIAEYSYGVPFSVNQVYPFIKDNIVALGFPDILFNPRIAYAKVIDELFAKDDVSIVLGLIPSKTPERGDMVVYDEIMNITDILIKSVDSAHLKYCWIVAIWKPEFSAFLNDFIQNELKQKSDSQLREGDYQMGETIIAAIKSGMRVKGVLFEEGSFIDIGTPGDLQLASEFLRDY